MEFNENSFLFIDDLVPKLSNLNTNEEQLRDYISFLLVNLENQLNLTNQYKINFENKDNSSNDIKELSLLKIKMDLQNKNSFNEIKKLNHQIFETNFLSKSRQTKIKSLEENVKKLTNIIKNLENDNLKKNEQNVNFSKMLKIKIKKIKILI
jgi:hypothetical protein